MRAEGQCRTGGTIEQSPIPFPVDPTIQWTRPERPAPSPRPRTPAPAPRTRGALTPTEKAHVIDARAAGDSAVTIALRLSCAPSTVWKILAEAREAS